MAAFNFDIFEAEFRTREMMEDVAVILDGMRNPANERVIPAQEGTPLHRLLGNLRVGAEQPLVEFLFELGEVITMDDAATRCRERRVAGQRAPVNLPEMLITAGQRVFFNTNMALPATFVEVSRPEASDLPSEIAVCHFLDGARTAIDWSESLPNLRRLAQQRRYTADMMQSALHRLVSRYTPELSHLVTEMTADQMANYLLRTQTNKDKTIYKRKELLQLTRQPDMELRAPLSNARLLIDRIYPPENQALAMQRSSAWRMAILSFLPDELAIPLADKLRVANEICRPITDERLERMAYIAEESYRKPPAFPLKFGRTIGSLPAASLIQFNSIETETAYAPNYGLPVSGIGRPYAVYPPFPPLMDDNGPLRQAAAARHQAALRQQQQQQEDQELQHQDFLNQQILAHQQQQALQQELAILPPPAGGPIYGTPRPPGAANALYPPPARPPLDLTGTPPTLAQSPRQHVAMQLARRNLILEQERLDEQDRLQQEQERIAANDQFAANEILGAAAAAQAVQTVFSPEDRQLPAFSGQITAVGDITDRDLTMSEAGKVFLRDGTMYINRGGSILRVIPGLGLGQSSAGSTPTQAKRKRGQGLPQPLGFDPIIQTRQQQQSGGRRTADQTPELHSLDLQPAWQNKVEQMESNIELLAVTVRESMEAVKALARSAANQQRTSGSSGQRPLTPLGHQSGQRSESYKRGEIRDGRYHSRERNEPGKISSSYNRQSSSRTQSQERGRSFSTSSQSRRSQSQSPGRSGRETIRPLGRQSRRDEHSAQRSRDSRTTYSKMKKGENCRADYDPLKMKECSKCSRGGHHEFECYSYEKYNPKLCNLCQRLHHYAGNCKEIEKFPPKGNELNNLEDAEN